MKLTTLAALAVLSLTSLTGCVTALIPGTPANARLVKAEAESRKAQKDKAEREHPSKHYLLARVCGEQVGSPGLYQYGAKGIQKLEEAGAWVEVEVSHNYQTCMEMYNSFVAKSLIKSDVTR